MKVHEHKRNNYVTNVTPKVSIIDRYTNYKVFPGLVRAKPGVESSIIHLEFEEEYAHSF